MNWLVLSGGHHDDDAVYNGILWNTPTHTGTSSSSSNHKNTESDTETTILVHQNNNNNNNNNNELPKSWNMNINMPVANLMKPPEIDPYESWWNGKVSLFGFMRYLLRDYLFSSSSSSSSEEGENDAALPSTSTNSSRDIVDKSPSSDAITVGSATGGAQKILLVDGYHGEHSISSGISESICSDVNTNNHLHNPLQQQDDSAAGSSSSCPTTPAAATAGDDSYDGTNGFNDLVKQNTLFEFRLMRIDPHRNEHHHRRPFSKIEGRSRAANNDGGSYTYTIVNSTDSPCFVFFTVVFFLHYSYLLLRSRSKSNETNNDDQCLSATEESSSSLAERERGTCAPSHIYLRGRQDDDDVDDLTCSEGDDDFEFAPVIPHTERFERTSSSRVPPVIPPLLQHESVTSTDADTGDINAVLESQITGVDGLPSYLISPRQSLRRRESMMRTLEDSLSGIPQSMPVEQSSLFLDDSATFVQSEDVKHFICFVTQVTEDENEQLPRNGAEGDACLSTNNLNELDIAHVKWRQKMTENGTIIASGAYAVSGTDGSSSKDGMMIIRATSYEAAQDIAMGDPYHQHCICTFRIMPWVVDNSAAGKILSPEQCQIIADKKPDASQGGEDKGDAIVG